MANKMTKAFPSVLTFDVWNTLITANKEFGAFRTQMIADVWDIDLTVAKAAYTATKTNLDNLAELTCLSLTSNKCWQLLGKNIHSMTGKKISDHDLFGTMQAVNLEFLAKPPLLRDDVVEGVLSLRQRGFRIGIVSNTNFVTGSVLQKILEPIAPDAAIYSDLFGVAKPNVALFNHTVRAIDQYVAMGRCFHFGDNEVCDGGARQAGMNFYHVKNPQDLAQQLKDFF